MPNMAPSLSKDPFSGGQEINNFVRELPGLVYFYEFSFLSDVLE